MKIPTFLTSPTTFNPDLIACVTKLSEEKSSEYTHNRIFLFGQLV